MTMEPVVAQTIGKAKSRVQWFLHHNLWQCWRSIVYMWKQTVFPQFYWLIFFCWLILFILDQNIYDKKVGFHNYPNIDINVLNSTWVFGGRKIERVVNTLGNFVKISNSIKQDENISYACVCVYMKIFIHLQEYIYIYY